MKRLSKLFLVLAVLLSDAMCATVAFNYCDIVWGIRYAGYSAPVYVAYLTGIPYAIGIIICLIVARILKKKAK